jgi:hypothetical protein
LWPPPLVATPEARTAAQAVEPSSRLRERAGAFSWFWGRWWPLAATLVGAIMLAAVLLLVLQCHEEYLTLGMISILAGPIM